MHILKALDDELDVIFDTAMKESMVQEIKKDEVVGPS